MNAHADIPHRNTADFEFQEPQILVKGEVGDLHDLYNWCADRGFYCAVDEFDFSEPCSRSTAPGIVVKIAAIRPFQSGPRATEIAARDLAHLLLINLDQSAATIIEKGHVIHVARVR